MSSFRLVTRKWCSNTGQMDGAGGVEGEGLVCSFWDFYCGERDAKTCQIEGFWGFRIFLISATDVWLRYTLVPSIFRSLHAAQ